MKRLLLLLGTLLTCSICLAGAWGPGNFDNDDALDWAGQCAASKGAGVVAATLQSALQAGEIEAPDGAMAVAAAEVVAAAKGKPGKALPRVLRDWLERQSKADIARLAPIARKAIVRVKDPKLSEMAQLWHESSDKQWLNMMAELEIRLQ